MIDRPADLVGPHEDGLAKAALMELSDADPESLRQMIVSALDELEITLDHDVGGKLDEDVVAIDNNGQVVVFLGWKGIEVALHGAELGEVSFCGIKFVDAVPAEQDRDRVAVDG